MRILTLLAGRQAAAAAGGVALLSALALTTASAQASVTQTFACVGSPQSAAAPAGALSAVITLNGAAGAAGGGNGESLTFEMPVSGAQQFSVNTGCQNGYNGGGAGGGGLGFGGGATDVTPLGGSFAQAYAVAAGGGGGGTSANGAGGAGGGAGQPGSDGAPASSVAATGGAGGGTPNGGAGGSGTYDPGSSGGTGSLGSGGGGGSAAQAGGGGGGGGWVGGGGGGGGGATLDSMFFFPESAGGGGGAGGSDHLSPAVTAQGSPSNTVTGDGSVTIVYTVVGDLSSSPNPTAYGQVTVGSSQIQTVTFTYNGLVSDDPITTGQAAISGPSQSAFTIVPGQDTCSNTSVTQGSSCTVEVQFAPSANGAQSATLSLPSDQASGTPATAALSGTGEFPASIAVTPNPESFGTVSQGLAGDKTFAVYNTGDRSLQVGQLSVTDSSGQFTLVADQDFCSAKTVPGGSYCLVEVVFTPTANGAQGATLTIPSNASNTSSQIVALSGTGAPAGTSSQGPTGPQGLTGGQGTTGTTGPQGQGLTGGQGTTGTTGPQGTTGRSPKSRPLVLSDVRLSAHTLTLCVGCTPYLTLSYRLNRLAALHVTLENRVAGHWRALATRTPPALGRRHGFRLRASGFIGHTLRAGSYRLVLVATNGHAHSQTFTVTLRVSAGG